MATPRRDGYFCVRAVTRGRARTRTRSRPSVTTGQLREDVAHVSRHGLLADEELVGDRAVGLAGRHQREHLHLARRHPGRGIGRHRLGHLLQPELPARRRAVRTPRGRRRAPSARRRRRRGLGTRGRSGRGRAASYGASSLRQPAHAARSEPSAARASPSANKTAPVHCSACARKNGAPISARSSSARRPRRATSPTRARSRRTGPARALG